MLVYGLLRRLRLLAMTTLLLTKQSSLVEQQHQRLFVSLCDRQSDAFLALVFAIAVFVRSFADLIRLQE